MPPWPSSDHCDGTRFHNPDGVDHGFGLALKWLAQRRNKAKWPRWITSHTADIPPSRVDAGTLRVTLVNHATTLIQVAGFNILTDPIWSQRCSPLSFAGPRRVHAPGIALPDLPVIDLVLLSHNHYDHLDLDTLTELKHRSTFNIVTGLGNSAYLHKKGLCNAKDLDWWEGVDMDGLSITFVPARHFSARGLHDRNRTLWGGFVLDAGPFRVYFAGDSGYGPHFAEIGRRFPGIDLALIPIGAYEPRWFMAPVHVNPDEAVQAHRDLGAAKSLAIHHGTFQLTDEPIDEPVKLLKRALAAAGLNQAEFAAPAYGTPVTVRHAKAGEL
jgi:L-ascorbate metabolism protein UlaG (beta-lactamase superfamily)